VAAPHSRGLAFVDTLGRRRGRPSADKFGAAHGAFPPDGAPLGMRGIYSDSRPNIIVTNVSLQGPHESKRRGEKAR
jgi:hypothetical protein